MWCVQVTFRVKPGVAVRVWVRDRTRGKFRVRARVNARFWICFRHVSWVVAHAFRLHIIVEGIHWSLK